MDRIAIFTLIGPNRKPCDIVKKFYQAILQKS